MNRFQNTLTAVVAALSFSVTAHAQNAVTLFQNVRIFDGQSAAPMNVLVRGNVIEKISAQPIPTDLRGDTKTIDGAGPTLMPGLIDNHVHLLMRASSQAQDARPRRQPRSHARARGQGGGADVAAQVHRSARHGRTGV